MAGKQKIKTETMYYWTKIGVVSITTKIFRNDKFRHKFMCHMSKALDEYSGRGTQVK